MKKSTSSSVESLQNLHAVVTGGGTGIGAEIAARLDELGMRVTVMGRRLDPLEATCTRLGEAQAVCVDVSDPESVKAAFTSAVNHFGPVSVLVNNAGSAVSAPFNKIELEDWQAVLAVNLTGTFLCTQQVLDGMRESGWGRVINVASSAGLKGYSHVASYCAAKHGIIGLTRSLALETARDGITINSICPGYTDTEMMNQALNNIVEKTGRTRKEALKQLTRLNPQGRLVQPAEVAAAVSWLCLPNSDAMTGQAIPVACGEVM